MKEILNRKQSKNVNMNLWDLPEEMIISIYNKLDNVTLVQLGKVSKKNFTISQEILSRREDLEYEKVLSLIDVIITKTVKLHMNNKDRRFKIFQWNKNITGGKKVVSQYYVREKIKNVDNAILFKLKIVVPQVLVTDSFIGRSTLIYLLGYMLRTEDWTGNYTAKIEE